jgi:UDP-glucuronate decarboxylase
MRLMNSGDDVTGPINLGNPVEFTMRQLAELVLELTGGKSGLVHRPLPSDDPRQRQPDITLAKQHLDWTPTAPLKVGLMRTIEYFDALLKAA